MNYAEKLKDPRWQKKRLKILERDEFACKLCMDECSTLNVHHLIYRSNTEPWDSKNDDLVTLCEACHKEETENRKASEFLLIKTLKEKGFLANDLDRISDGFRDLIIEMAPEVTSSFLKFIFSSKETQDIMWDMYWENARKRSKVFSEVKKNG